MRWEVNPSKISQPSTLTADLLANMGPHGPKTSSNVSRPPALDEKEVDPKTEAMSDVTRQEMNARLEATEAKVLATLETIKRENADARADIRAASDAASKEISEFSGRIEAAFSEHFRRVDSSMSGLKIWVLAGALTGVLSLLAVVLAAVVRTAMGATPAG